MCGDAGLPIRITPLFVVVFVGASAPLALAGGGFGHERNSCGCDGEIDVIPPEISCPAPITLERGDKLCNSAVQDWLDSTSATDNCDADVEIVHDSAANGFECGFPFDSTTTVTWTATDDCGNAAVCSSTITIKPAKRVDVSKKGSLLVYPKIEIKWDAAGQVTQDTFVTIANDYPDDVHVHWYFVNGDEPLDAVYVGDLLTPVEPGHPGWNWVNCTTYLTHDEPTYFSALTGLPAGCQPFTTLDNADGVVGRLDPQALRLEDLAQILSAMGPKPVTVEMLQADIDDGAPVNLDGTMNLLQYAAWLARNVLQHISG